MMGRVRIVLRIAVSVVHPVKHGISTGTQVRRTLGHPGKHVKYFFPERTGGKHLVRGVTVQKERLKEQRQVPVGNEESNDNHRRVGLVMTMQDNLLCQ